MGLRRIASVTMHRVLMIAVFVCGTSVLAQNADTSRNAQLTHDGIVYEYKSIPHLDSNGQPMYYTGEMSGKRNGKELEFFQKTQQSPGCDGNFPAISMIDIPHQKTAGTQTYVIFCGSYEGRNNTLRFYVPGQGVTSTINVNNFMPAISKEKNDTDITIYREIWPNSISAKISYPVIYKIFSDQYVIKLVQLDKNNEINIREKYQSLLDKTQYPETRDWVVARNLIILSLSGDEGAYCSLAKMVNNAELFSEIETEVGLPIVTAKCSSRHIGRATRHQQHHHQHHHGNNRHNPQVDAVPACGVQQAAGAE